MKIKLNINKLSFYFRRASQEYSNEEEIRDITCSSSRSLNSKSPLILKKLLFIFNRVRMSNGGISNDGEK